MTIHHIIDPGQRLLELVLQSPGSDVEDIVLACPDLTWNQVFSELDRLSRSGGIVLRQKRPGSYSVAPPTEVGANTLTH